MVFDWNAGRASVTDICGVRALTRGQEVGIKETKRRKGENRNPFKFEAATDWLVVDLGEKKKGNAEKKEKLNFPWGKKRWRTTIKRKEKQFTCRLLARNLKNKAFGDILGSLINSVSLGGDLLAVGGRKDHPLWGRKPQGTEENTEGIYSWSPMSSRDQGTMMGTSRVTVKDEQISQKRCLNQESDWAGRTRKKGADDEGTKQLRNARHACRS